MSDNSDKQNKSINVKVGAVVGTSDGECAAGGGSSTASLKDSQMLSIELWIQYLVHSCHCQDINCGITSRHNTKRDANERSAKMEGLELKQLLAVRYAKHSFICTFFTQNIVHKTNVRFLIVLILSIN